MPDATERTAEKSVLDQSYALLEYLSAVAREIGPKPVRDIRSNETVVWPSAVPVHRAVAVGPGEDRPAWLSVARVPAPPVLDVPSGLIGLVGPKGALESASSEPRLLEQAAKQRVESRVIEELGPPDRGADEEVLQRRRELREQLMKGVRDAFDKWVAGTWVTWAETHRPTFAARDLYTRLYELHLRAEADAATHEIIWGQLVLGVRTENESIVSPMLTSRAIIEVDPQDATIRVIPEQTVELELNAVEGTGLSGLEALTRLQATLRDTPPNVWDDDERLATRQQIVAPMGLDASLVEDVDFPAPAAAPRLNDGWVLFLRRRPMRQERFYDELAHKIRAENFLPEGLASVVADSDRVDDAILGMGRTVVSNDGTAERLLMPLPANAEQARIAQQLATSRGVTVQGPPGTGKSHTIVNLVSHLVAQGKRVLVTAEKEQALTVLRDKIPSELRDLSLAVLGSTPSAMEDLRSSAQAMQDSLSSLDVATEERRIAELGSTVDVLRESIVRTDAALVRALQSEQSEYLLPAGSARAPQVAEWLAERRHLDVVADRVPTDASFPVSTDELAELRDTLRVVSAEESAAAVLDLPEADWLPTAADLHERLSRRETLRTAVTSLEDQGLRVDALDALSLDSMRENSQWFRESAVYLRTISGSWQDQFAAAVRSNDPAASWVMQHNVAVRQKLGMARDLASRLTGHIVDVPDGNPAEQVPLLQAWSERVAAGKKLPLFASKELKELAAAVRVDGSAITTPAQLELVRTEVELRAMKRDAYVTMSQTYAACQIPVPPQDGAFVFVAPQLASSVDAIHHWWTNAAPALMERVGQFATTRPGILTSEALEMMAGLLDRAAARVEERQLSAELDRLAARVQEASRADHASPLWGNLYTALQLAQVDRWGDALDEAQRLAGVRARVLRADELRRRIADAGAPRWARSIAESRGAHETIGEIEDAPLAWDRAKARTWLANLHSTTDIDELMEKSHTDSQELQRTIVDLASRSARTELKNNSKDRQRRALETWLSAVKRVGKGTGKNAPRFQAAAREALPAAMGAVPVWIMPIYRVLENFDPRVSDLFDVVVVDESSQCDLLSLGVLALGKKTVVVGDDKQTTPARVGIQTDRIAALQDQHLRGMPEAKLLTLDDSLYSISGRAFPSTIALKEHFRCVPEIIGFSNRYYGGQILPLREVGVPQIGEPLRVIHVEDAVSMKSGTSRVNYDEAKVIAAQIAQCANDTAYDGLTFGVVTMMSGPQAQIIQDLIREEIGDAEFERRRLRVGNPPLFQGDERNVMFVSMVAHDASYAATSPMYSQWANVAASRAQDQLWIVHSMDPSTLNHADQRRAMIEYAQGHHRGEEADDLYARTESKFERDVLTKLLERGFTVDPQHRVGSYRIDMVVNVARGERLAIECDGDAFHGPEKWDEDVRRQRVLERLGWTFWRIRASKYYLDPEAALEPLWQRLEEMRERAEGTEKLARVRQEARDAKRLAELRADAAQDAATQNGRVSTDSVEELSPSDVVVVGMERIELTEIVETSDEDDSTTLPQSQSMQQQGGPLTPTVSNIREWAREQGHSIGERGRIPDHVRDAYLEAHSVRAVPEPTLPGLSVPRLTGESKRLMRGVGGAQPTEMQSAEEPALLMLGGNAADAAAAWGGGLPYQLDTQGNVQSLNGGRTLADVIGADRAAVVRDLMWAVRPSGGRFKVDQRGTMATLVDGDPVYVCTVTRAGWFPSHWKKG
ncbi:very short patch repair endonuclease [Microbacterium sorbitolivorans]|nr:histone-like nucleoid-structuring protein Lsr2 [Microbacterium sorbitolivorans]GGF41910.1 very short patch repair endonuclease [Microbacterium sorbitolivorans]